MWYIKMHKDIADEPSVARNDQKSYVAGYLQNYIFNKH